MLLTQTYLYVLCMSLRYCVPQGMYPPPHMTCMYVLCMSLRYCVPQRMYPPPHMTCMYVLCMSLRYCVPQVEISISPSYTGPTSPGVDKNLLHKWTRAGDGDPRSKTYYTDDNPATGTNGEATAQLLSVNSLAWTLPGVPFAETEDSMSDLGSVSCHMRRRIHACHMRRRIQTEDSMSDLGSVADSCMTASTGLQSEGLQSNAHAFRAEMDPNVHAMQKIYSDLDEANIILERFYNKHMLPPPLEVEAERRVRKIRLKLDYMSSRSKHVMLDTFSTDREGEAVSLLVHWLYVIMSLGFRV